MAEEKRSAAHLERELAALKLQMAASGMKVPVTVAGSFKYSGEEEKFKNKEYAFKTGCQRIRERAENFTLTASEKSTLFDKRGFLIAKEAIKNAKVMIALIERGVGVLEEILTDEPVKKADTPVAK